MYKPIQHTLLGLAGMALLAQWVVAVQALAAATPTISDSTSYTVQAESNQPAAEIKHGYFSLSLKAGQTQTVHIIVKNTGKSVLQLSDYPADSAQIAAGGVAFSAQNSPVNAVGTTITIQPRSLNLAPGEMQRVAATITMPKNAKAGDYVGGLAVENSVVQKQSGSSNMRISVYYRQVIAILATVPGTLISSAAVGKVGLAPMLSVAQAAIYLQASSTKKPLLKGSVATVVVNNTGNVLWKGTGVLRIGGLKNSTSIPFTVGTILVNSSATIAVRLPALDLTPGSYNMSVTLQAAVKSAPIKWSGLTALTLPVAAAAATAVPNLALQPAHPATAGTATMLNQGAPVSTASSSQSTSLVLFGGGAVVLIILGVGLGMVFSRRSSGRPGPPVALPLVK